MSDYYHADTMTLRAGDDWTASFTNLGNLTGIDDLVFAIKRAPTDPDDDAVVLVTVDAGLERINGKAATAAEGSLTVDDELDGNITFELQAEASVLLPKTTDSFYAIKSVPSGGGGTTLQTGRVIIQPAIVSRIA